MILRCYILFVVITNFIAGADILIDNDGGYKNIIVGISPNLQKLELETIISQLKVRIIFYKSYFKSESISSMIEFTSV